MLKKYFGPKEFYQKTTKLAFPLALQMLLGSAMGIIDTMMVSWIGMVTPVGTAAQLDMLCSMIAYGAIGGTAIFAAQFFGANDNHNLRKTFGLSIVLSFINAIFWFVISTFFGYQICYFYMPDAAICINAVKYLNIFKFSFVFGSISFSFGAMLRSIGKANISLMSSILATISNVILNFVLIFGYGPFPKMGIEGAALASVLAQVIGLVFVIIYCVKTKQPFLGSFKEMFSLNSSFVKPIINKILPLIINETLFGFGSTLFVKAFGKLGQQSMDAYYVGNQIFNVFLFIVYGYGNAVSILLGNLLGSGKTEEAKIECNYHLGLSLVLSIMLVIIMIIFAPFMVSIFGLTNPQTYALAVSIVYVLAVKISMRLFNFNIFCILKSGGESKIVQRLDSGIVWLVGLPCAFICVDLLHIDSIVIVLLICQLEQLVRLILGMRHVLSFKWANNITSMVN